MPQADDDAPAIAAPQRTEEEVEEEARQAFNLPQVELNAPGGGLRVRLGNPDEAPPPTGQAPRAPRPKGPAAKAAPAKATPAKATPAKATPAKATPAKATPAKATPRRPSPQGPTRAARHRGGRPHLARGARPHPRRLRQAARQAVRRRQDDGRSPPRRPGGGPLHGRHRGAHRPGPRRAAARDHEQAAAPGSREGVGLPEGRDRGHPPARRHGAGPREGPPPRHHGRRRQRRREDDHHRQAGPQVLRPGQARPLAAGDTFRAAAVEQLEVWGGRAGVAVVRGEEKQDPSSVIYEACRRARAEGYDILIADTAGRLQARKELMDELAKIHRVIGKAMPGAPHEVWLVLDATNGQNAISQAQVFTEVVDVTGLVLTKLDGTAKGGVVIGISNEMRLPVRFIGIGEKVEDLRAFEPAAFVDALFAET
ncbi:MAG: hypothetical protein R3F60_20105 [bacterium]